MKKIMTIFITMTLLIMIFVPTVQATSNLEGNKLASNVIDDIFNGGDDFINEGDTSKINQEPVQVLIQNLTSVAMTIGVIVAVVAGIIISIKFMMDGAVGKAELKTALTPYLIGVCILFGAFAIWQIIINIFFNVFSE